MLLGFHVPSVFGERLGIPKEEQENVVWGDVVGKRLMSYRMFLCYICSQDMDAHGVLITRLQVRQYKTDTGNQVSMSVDKKPLTLVILKPGHIRREESAEKIEPALLVQRGQDTKEH